MLALADSIAGVEAVQEIIRRAGVPSEKRFHIDRAYDDAEWQRLLSSACEVLEITTEQAEEKLADHFFEDMKRRWPMWFKMARTAREFLERVPAIHAGFTMGLSDRTVGRSLEEKFELEEIADGFLMHYRSENDLCGMYRNLARKVIDHFGDHASIDESRCTRRGDPFCRIRIHWHPAPVGGEESRAGGVSDE